MHSDTSGPGATLERRNGTASAPRRVSFFVPGKPRSQGSKRHVGNGIMVESSKHVMPWRERITLFARQAWPHAPLTCPVRLDLTFLFARAKSHFHQSKRRMGQLREDAPPFPVGLSTHGDYEKLARAVSDAIAGVILQDDKLVVTGHVRKRFAEVEGAEIVVTEETELPLGRPDPIPGGSGSPLGAPGGPF